MTGRAVDLDALEAVARAATPGPWTRNGVRRKIGPESYIVVAAREEGFAFLPIGSQQNDKFHATAFRDAKHIATFDPPTVLAMIAELRAARAGQGGER